MRVLVTIAHYFKADNSPEWQHGLGSGRAPLAKIAALNAQIVALHRYFGPRRLSRNPEEPQARAVISRNTIDIVIMTKRDAHLLEWIGINPSLYHVDYFDGDPLMLAFEAQRIMRERFGKYDLYVYMEDDMIVDDPEFFAKIKWFADAFGPQAVLLPVRFEMAYTGMLTKAAIAPRLSRDKRAPFCRADLPRTLGGRWNGREQTFRLPNNPHMACYVLTTAQLKFWIEQPTFYDRDASWVDPLVSAATFGLGKVFGIYISAEPDPWFLGVEHYGTRYAASLAAPGEVFGEPPLLAIAEKLLAEGSGAAAAQLAKLGMHSNTVNAIVAEAAELRSELHALKRSRTRLVRALFASMWNKAQERKN